MRENIVWALGFIALIAFYLLGAPAHAQQGMAEGTGGFIKCLDGTRAGLIWLKDYRPGKCNLAIDVADTPAAAKDRSIDSAALGAVRKKTDKRYYPEGNIQGSGWLPAYCSPDLKPCPCKNVDGHDALIPYIVVGGNVYPNGWGKANCEKP